MCRGIKCRKPVTFDCKFATSQEPSEGELNSYIERCMEWGCGGVDGHNECSQDRERDGCNLPTGFLSEIPLDAPDDALNKWSFDCLKWEICIDMEGFDMAEIGLDSCCFDLSREAEVSDPFKDCCFASQEE
jgi:hypothetical protein